MNQAHAILALLALGALWLWRRRESSETSAPVVVRGATVSVSNVEAVEERRLWRWVGERAWINPVELGIAYVQPGALVLEPGALYDWKPSLPGRFGSSGTGFLIYTVPRGSTTGGPGRYDPEADWWDAAWESVILTAGEQISEGGFKTVPPAFKG